MELGFSDLRTKEVVSLSDGRQLGKVCDLIFCYPENRIIGLVAGRGCWPFRSEQYIDLKNVVRIGGDVILVNCAFTPKTSGKSRGRSRASACPPPCPPCPPPCPQDRDPATGARDFSDGRRSYDEYE